MARQIAFYDHCARHHGWQKVPITTRNDTLHRQRYCKDPGGDDGTMWIVDCWPTTKTIASFLKHPRQKKTQLFRQECDDDLTRRIFENPRVHTGKGYQRRDNNNNNNNTNPHKHHSKRGRDETVAVEEEEGDQQRPKRRRLTCQEGQFCRDWHCPFSHPPRCFYGRRCWFQPNCWFDHTRGLCRYRNQCAREDCHFSHRHPDFYY